MAAKKKTVNNKGKLLLPVYQNIYLCKKHNRPVRTKESYGGYLPLEISPSRSHRQRFEKKLKVLSLNTVNAGIPLVQQHSQKEAVYCPYYLCPNVIAVLKGCFKTVLFYNISSELVPDGDIFNDPSAAVYLVNYFGVIGKKVRHIVQAHHDCTFIVDNAHAFFEKPIARDNVYTLYSCRKFFGVPDGAYLVSTGKVQCDYSDSQGWPHSEYLLKSLECGTNAAYSEKKEADGYLLAHPARMSVLSRSLLGSIDYDRIRRKRKANFLVYERELGARNRIACEHRSIPYVYPFNAGKNIKKELVDRRIYVPTLWNLPSELSGMTYEKYLSDNTIFLPLDQRYSQDDISYICFTVQGLMERFND